MKKLVLALAIVFLLTGCGAKNNGTNAGENNGKGVTEETTDKKKVTVTTSFLNDMVHQLAGDFVEREMIIPAGEDPHLYVAKSQDMNKIADADLLLYHGLHFEGKMIDVLEKEGVSVSEDFDMSKVGEMEQDGEIIMDPHFWFDIDLYKLATERAAKALQELVPEHQEEIAANLEEYLKELDELDAYNREQLATIPEATRYLITPHDAFNYFSRRYNIQVVAPQGVSTDSEVANKDIDETVNFIVEHKVPAIFAESTTDPARMEKLKESCGAKGWDVRVVGGEGNELFSDSLAPEGQDGDTFISMYKHNVNLIVENLK